MPALEELSAVIAEIYDAALAPDRWPSVLEACAAFVAAQGAGLLLKSAIAGVGEIHHQTGVSPHYIALYETEFWRYDPLGPLVLSEVGTVASREDFVGDEEFAAGRFNREWARPQGWVDAANVVLERSATAFSVLSFLRAEAAGRVDGEMRRRVGLLVPHVRRSLAISSALDTARLRAERIEAVIERIDAGVLLIDEAGRVVLANDGARTLAARGVIAMPQARLARGPASRFAAGGLLAAVATGEGTTIEIELGEGPAHIVHVVPLSARSAAGASHLVLIRPVSFPLPAAPGLLQARHGLTPAEMRVLLALAEADGVPAIAARLGVSENTVSTHLGRIYLKTGTRRQVELVKLLAANAGPLDLA